MKCKRIAVIIFLLIAFLISGCTDKNESTSETNVLQKSTSNENMPNENELYNEIFNNASTGDVTFTFTSFQEDEIIKEYTRVVSEHPELFWLGNGYSYETITDNNGKTVTFECAHIPLQNIAEKRSDFDRVVNEVLNDANRQKTLYEKVIYIHDYIIDNTQYDQETYKIMNESKDSKEIYEATTAYGCLVNKKAVCSGYSAAFQLFMQKLGIPSGRVSGRKKAERIMSGIT